MVEQSGVLPDNFQMPSRAQGSSCSRKSDYVRKKFELARNNPQGFFETGDAVSLDLGAQILMVIFRGSFSAHSQGSDRQGFEWVGLEE